MLKKGQTPLLRQGPNDPLGVPPPDGSTRLTSPRVQSLIKNPGWAAHLHRLLQHVLGQVVERLHKLVFALGVYGL